MELLDELGVDRFACTGESNGGMVTLAVAAALPDRVLGAVPVNPTLPWHDPVARRVSSRSAAAGYRMIRYLPRVVAGLAGRARQGGVPSSGAAAGAELLGPPPGTEPDVAALHRRVLAEPAGRDALRAELFWAGSEWGFDHYAIEVPMEVFCGVYDVQAPFALVLADRNPDARFHYFPHGHHGFSHPDARRRIVDAVAGHGAR